MLLAKSALPPPPWDFLCLHGCRRFRADGLACGRGACCRAKACGKEELVQVRRGTVAVGQGGTGGLGDGVHLDGCYLCQPAGRSWAARAAM